MTTFDTLPRLGDCIAALGQAAFYPCFYELIQGLAPVDQYMVFEFLPCGTAISSRLAHNPLHPDLGVELALDYVSGGYLGDTLLQQLRERLVQSPEDCSAVLLDKRTLPGEYRRRFFNTPQFEAKFAFVALDKPSGHLFYINFYSRDFPDATAAIMTRLNSYTQLIAALIVKHCRLAQDQTARAQRLLASGLSKREAQICDLIVGGHSAKSIAKRLGLSENSVITYKTRAYGKLHITRKSQLIDAMSPSVP